jgi:dihydrofolate reductase
VYGRRTYEIMRYWDEDLPEWDAEDLDFAAAWRNLPKWVVWRSLKSVGPNATLVQNDVGTVLRELKARLVGEIDVAGPDLARSLTDLGLVDEYRLYFRPFVLGHGTPFFAGPRPPLRLVASDPIGEDTIRLTYVPAKSRNSPDGLRRRVRPAANEHGATSWAGTGSNCRIRPAGAIAGGKGCFRQKPPWRFGGTSPQPLDRCQPSSTRPPARGGID